MFNFSRPPNDINYPKRPENPTAHSSKLPVPIRQQYYLWPAQFRLSCNFPANSWSLASIPRHMFILQEYQLFVQGR